MGGSSICDDWEFTTPDNSKTFVLIGRTGNGKSATGNSILGRKAFKSMRSQSGVTSSSEFQQTVLDDGQIINVIDTPGLFDSYCDPEFVGSELVKCINMAKDGIHAVLLVLSVRNRFSKEEEAAVMSFSEFFGSKLQDYMIVVFTGGDELEEDGETLDEHLGRTSTEPLTQILELCGNRKVLFDNKTKNEKKKVEQVQELLSVVNKVIDLNNGKPYTDEIFTELKDGAAKLRNQTAEVISGYTSKQELSELRDQMTKSYTEQLKRITEMVESKLKETTLRLEKQLAEEQAARLQAEERAREANQKSNEEIRKLRENLEKAQRETDELRRRAASCHIL